MQVRRDAPPISISQSTWILTVQSRMVTKDVGSLISSLYRLATSNLTGGVSVDRTSQEWS